VLLAECTVIEEYADGTTRTREGTEDECRAPGLDEDSQRRDGRSTRSSTSGRGPGTRSFSVALEQGNVTGKFVDGTSFVLRGLPRITNGTFAYTDQSGRLVALPLREVVSVDSGKRHPCGSCERDANGQFVPSAAARAAFLATHPCPAPGPGGTCPGHVVDHITPLACGGTDEPLNMQWQTEGQMKVKMAWVQKACGS
jgi:hypothetical protein